MVSAYIVVYITSELFSLMKYAGPLKISIVYLLTGFIWIYGSDSFTQAFFPAVSQQYLFQTIKGIFYVVSTALLLYYLLLRFYKAQQQKVDELRESEQRYQFLFLSSPLAKIIYDADTGKIQEVNERASAFLGFSEEELLRRQVTEVFPEKDLAELAVLEGVVRYVKPDGMHLSLEAAASAFNYKGAHMILLSLDDVSAREEAQQLLEEHRRKLIAAQKIANIGYWQSFNGLYWSDEVYKIWGLNKDTFELNYESFLQTVYPEDRYLFFSEYEDVDKDELEYDIEHRFMRPDGSIRWARQWGILIRKDKDSPFRGEGTVQDITDVKNISLFLDKASRMAMIGAWEWNISDEHVRWSPITREIHEVPEDYEPSLEGGIAFYTGTSRQAILELIHIAVNSGQSWDIEAQIMTAKGNVKWVRSLGQAEMVDGVCVRLYGSFQDIDRLKRSEVAIIEALQTQVLTLERMRDGYISVDREWTVRYWNSSAEQLLGRKRGEALGKNLWELYADAVDSDFYHHFVAVMETGSSASFEAFYPTTDAWYELDVFPSDQGIAIFFKDITERKNYLQTVERQNQTLKEIAWSQSHEVRSPLARLLALVRLLEDMRPDRDDELKELLQLITGSAHELDDIIRKITVSTSSH